MNLSDLPRTLRRMMLLAAAVWAAIAVPVAVAVGRAVRIAEQRRPAYTPQTDVPLWRGTDAPHPGRCRSEWGCAPDGCDYGGAGTDAPDPAPIPEPDGSSLPGAILGLGFATDETTARYWLSLCARRGATWQQQRDLWDMWQRQQAATVTHLHTYRDREERHP